MAKNTGTKNTNSKVGNTGRQPRMIVMIVKMSSVIKDKENNWFWNIQLLLGCGNAVEPVGPLSPHLHRQPVMMMKSRTPMWNEQHLITQVHTIQVVHTDRSITSDRI